MVLLRALPKGRPPSLRASVTQARGFYQRKNEPGLYTHCHKVLARASGERMVEGGAIGSGDDPARAWANSVLASVILYHVVDSSKLKAHSDRLPEPLSMEHVRSELDVYSQLMELDIREAELMEYAELLGVEAPPLALLARIADFSVTHIDGEDLGPFVRPNDPGPEHTELFRRYSSNTEANDSLIRDAHAGESIYAPLAELFGYPKMAGDILKHAYAIRHKAICRHVLEALTDKDMQNRIRFTQTVANLLKRRLQHEIKEMGYTGVVEIRAQKSEGKVMRKVQRLLEEEYENSVLKERMDLPTYIQLKVPQFDLRRIRDFVALRVILHRFNGEEIDGMEPQKKQTALEIVRDAIEASIKRLSLEISKLRFYMEFRIKKNGYRAHHVDVEPVLDSRLLSFEIQLKTRTWHEVAERGGAAHYLYLGGDSEFTGIVRRAYREIIEHLGNGAGRRQV